MEIGIVAAFSVVVRHAPLRLFLSPVSQPFDNVSPPLENSALQSPFALALFLLSAARWTEQRRPFAIPYKPFAPERSPLSFPNRPFLELQRPFQIPGRRLNLSPRPVRGHRSRKLSLHPYSADSPRKNACLSLCVPDRALHIIRAEGNFRRLGPGSLDDPRGERRFFSFLLSETRPFLAFLDFVHTDLRPSFLLWVIHAWTGWFFPSIRHPFLRTRFAGSSPPLFPYL